MPAFVRFLPHIGLALALLGAVWWIDRNAAERTRLQIDARAKASEILMRKELRAVELNLAETIGAEGATYEGQRLAIDQARGIIQSTISKELAGAARYSDSASGLSAGLLEALNRARASGACATAPSGRIECAVPATAASGEPQDR